MLNRTKQYVHSVQGRNNELTESMIQCAKDILYDRFQNHLSRLGVRTTAEQLHKLFSEHDRLITDIVVTQIGDRKTMSDT